MSPFENNNFPTTKWKNETSVTRPRIDRNPREIRGGEQLSIRWIGFQSAVDVLRCDQGQENDFCKAVRKLRMRAVHTRGRQLRRAGNIFTGASPYKGARLSNGFSKENRKACLFSRKREVNRSPEWSSFWKRFNASFNDFYFGVKNTRLILLGGFKRIFMEILCNERCIYI